MKIFYPSKADFIAVVGNFSSGKLLRHVKRSIKETSIPVRGLRARKSLKGVDFSDHRNYWQFGYSAVMITDTSFYRNPHYHKASDTIETLDFSKMREVVKGILIALIDIERL